MTNPARNIAIEPQSEEAIVDNTNEAIYANTTVAEAMEYELLYFDFAISGDEIAKSA